MKRLIVLTLTAGMISAAAPALVAETSTNAPSQAEISKPSPQQRRMERRRLMTLIGLSGKELKGLTAQERRARIKDATEQKIAQLQQEKANGTLTAEGQSDLAFLESHLKHGKGKAKADAEN